MLKKIDSCLSQQQHCCIKQDIYQNLSEEELNWILQEQLFLKTFMNESQIDHLGKICIAFRYNSNLSNSSQFYTLNHILYDLIHKPGKLFIINNCTFSLMTLNAFDIFLELIHNIVIWWVRIPIYNFFITVRLELIAIGKVNNLRNIYNPFCKFGMFCCI